MAKAKEKAKAKERAKAKEKAKEKAKAKEKVKQRQRQRKLWTVLITRQEEQNELGNHKITKILIMI